MDPSREIKIPNSQILIGLSKKLEIYILNQS